MVQVNSDPKYDTDAVNLRYLNKVLESTEKENNDKIKQIPKNYGIQPLPPYAVGDSYTVGKKIYKCIKSRDIGSFNISDWQLIVDGEELQNFINNIYTVDKIDITEQLDNKIETYIQDEDPSLEWTTDIEKEKHKGDYWRKNSSNGQKEYCYTKMSTNPITYRWIETDAPAPIYDLIDGKKTIYTSKPSFYSKDDMWVIEDNLSDDDLPTNVKRGDWVFATENSDNYNKLHWIKRDEKVDIEYVEKYYYQITEIDNKFTEISRDTDSKITKAKDDITLSVSQNYTTKGETNSVVNRVSNVEEEIGTVTETVTTHGKTLAQLNVSTGEIRQTVSQTIEKQTNIEATLEDTNEDISIMKNQINTSIKGITPYYAISTSNTISPTQNWSTTVPTRNTNEYLWRKDLITYQNNNLEYTVPYVVTGDKGNNGANGQDGKTGVDGKSVYQVWLENGNTGTEQDFLNSLKGEQGIPGQPGIDGTSTYFYIRYADNENGTSMTILPTSKTEYMGVASTTSPTAPTNSSAYTWSKIKGDSGADGQQGIPGQPGENGLNSYIHIKWSSDGQNFSENNGEVPDRWQGTYVDNIEEDSNDFNDYNWVDTAIVVDSELNDIRNSVNEVDSKAESIKTDLNNNYLTSSEVEAELGTQREDIALIKRQQTDLIQTASEIQASVTEIVDNGVQSIKNTMVTIDIDGIKVATNIDKFSSLLNNKGLFLYGYGYEVARFTNEGTVLDNLIVRNYFVSGYHRTEKYIDAEGEKWTAQFFIGE